MKAMKAMKANQVKTVLFLGGGGTKERKKERGLGKCEVKGREHW